MGKMGRLSWVGSRLGRRLCTGGGGVLDQRYCLKPFCYHLPPTYIWSSSPLFTSPFHSQSTPDEELGDNKKQLVEHVDPISPLHPQQHLKAAENQAAPSPPVYRHYVHVRSTPLLDLLSVCIQSSDNTSSDVDDDYDDQRPLEVYGTIQLIDVENGSTSYVYRRRRRKPETVLPGYNLTLTNSKGSYSSFLVPKAASYKLRLNLKDANFHGKVIAKGDFDLQLLSDNDKIMTQAVPGRNGFYASVSYAALPHAVVATVKMTLTKIGEIGYNQRAKFYGCISASSKLRQGNIISSVLLDKPLSDPLKVILGKPIELSRHVLAVPAYSSLEIKADLWDYYTDKKIASDVTLADCEAQDNDVELHTCILGETYHVRTQICWNNPYELLDKVTKPFHKQHILCDKRSYSTLSSRASEEELALSPIPSFSRSALVEVFSITVSPDCDTNSRIWGKIHVYDNEIAARIPYYLFQRDASNVVSLSRDMEVKSIVWPKYPFIGWCFVMSLHLYDDMGHEFCHGYLDCDALSEDMASWYGKLISSVIRGAHGYVTVNYAIFPNAVQAKVRVEVIPDDSEVRFMVGGNISAWYSKLYLSCSEKLCRNTLLRDDLYQLIESGDNVLKLQKSSMAMPLDSSLIIGIKLEVGVVGETSKSPFSSKHKDRFDEVVDLKVDVGKVSFKSIPRGGYKVDVHVEWNKVCMTEKLDCLLYLKDCLSSSPQED